jgi:hypothetical protein
MSLINKIEEEFALLRQFLVSTLGEHIHIHSGVDDALDAVKAAVREEVPSAGGDTTANPAASEVPEASSAPPSAPVTEEIPTPAQPSDTEEK